MTFTWSQRNWQTRAANILTGGAVFIWDDTTGASPAWNSYRGRRSAFGAKKRRGSRGAHR